MPKANLIVLALIAALSLVACGGDSGGSNGGSNAAPDTDGDPDAFCTAAQELALAIGSAGSPDLEAMAAALADMEASAPEEIREDVTTVKDAIDAGLAGEASGDPMQETEVQAANDRIFEYLGSSDCEPPDDAS